MHIAVEAGSKQQQHDKWILGSDELRLLLNFFIFFYLESLSGRKKQKQLKEWYDMVKKAVRPLNVCNRKPPTNAYYCCSIILVSSYLMH